ncbi:MAG: hypothetical protein AAFY88_32540, partial [Acidobacteriota bacterium]
APRLAELIGVGVRTSDYSTSDQKRSYEVMALAVLASLCRRVGRVSDARGYYARAFALAQQGKVSVRVSGELLRRFGLLQTMLREPDALDFHNRAVALLEEAPDAANELADALNSRGHHFASNDRFRRAADDFAAAARAADPGTASGRRTAEAATLNLGFMLSLGPFNIADRARVAQLIEDARRSMVGTRSSKTRSLLLWMEGWLYHELGFDRHAARLIGRARKGLLTEGLAIELAMASLDLAVVLHSDGEIERFQRLRAHTEQALEGLLDETPELREVLSQWSTVPSGLPSTDELEHIKAKIRRMAEEQCRSLAVDPAGAVQWARS